MLLLRVSAGPVRFSSSLESARVKIGRAIRNIPLDYLNFFTRPAPHVIDLHPYHPEQFKLVLHLDQLLHGKTDASETERLFEIGGVANLAAFTRRLRFLTLWGHFFWRVPALSALQVEVTRVVLQPPSMSNADLPDRVIMRLYWQLKSCEPVSEEYTWRTLFAVQIERLQRLIGWSRPNASSTPTVLYTGISRYIFDGKDGWCRELHIERLEPRLSGSQFGKQKQWLAQLAASSAEPALNVTKCKGPLFGNQNGVFTR